MRKRKVAGDPCRAGLLAAVASLWIPALGAPQSSLPALGDGIPPGHRAAGSATAVDDVVLFSSAGRSVGKAPAARIAPAPVVGRADLAASAGVTTYRWDDGEFEGAYLAVHAGSSNRPVYAQGYGQAFLPSRPGRLRWLEACFSPWGATAAVGHDFTFQLLHEGEYREWPVSVRLSFQGEFCWREHVALDLKASDVWVAVNWVNDEDNLVGMLADRFGPARTRIRVTRRTYSSSDWDSWRDPNAGEGCIHGGRSERCSWQALGIRMGVEHPEQPLNPGEESEPLNPGEESDCVPQTAALTLDGHDVGVCWHTSDGKTGDGRAGLWSNDQAGLIWFFDRSNAELLVKLLDFCSTRGTRWVSVAGTSSLAFNVKITAPEDPSGGVQAFTYLHASGAPPDTWVGTAFVCE